VTGVVAAPVDLLGRVLLHGGAHAPATEPSAGVQAEFLAVSAVVVGLVGGLLYWYYGQRIGTD